MSATISSIALLLSAEIRALLPHVGSSELMLRASANAASCGLVCTWPKQDSSPLGRGSRASISRPRDRRPPLMRVSPSIR
jgi:hypothetical protein